MNTEYCLSITGQLQVYSKSLLLKILTLNQPGITCGILNVHWNRFYYKEIPMKKELIIYWDSGTSTSTENRMN